MTTPPPTDPLIGATVSQYEIVSKLGGGGMGVVYKARDIKLGRSVALKFLPPQWSHDESAKQRFVREAQAASATNHRNICVIHNIDETVDGRLFIVMAYYEGETLKQKLERGPLPINEAIEIASEIADGLAKAHAQGVIHRDVKPGNLIVTEDGVKILDFGLAKFADALQLTVPGSTIGTIAYMSPEQARGDEADARSDVWALGIVLFEMLTGSVPFRGTYQEATFHAIKHEPMPSLRAIRPEIPDALERIVMKALEKDPKNRFQSAREPARDLKLLAGRTVPVDLLTIEVPRPAGVGPDSLPKRSVWRRVVTPVRLGIAGALLIASAAGWYLWSTRPVERIRVAIVPVANHTGMTELDSYRLGLTSALIDELAESPNVRVVPFLRLLEMIRPFMSMNADISNNEAVRSIANESGAQFLVVPTFVHRDRDATWTMQIQIRNASTGTAVASYETTPVTSSLIQQTAFRLTVTAADQVQQHFKTNGPGRAYTPRTTDSQFREADAARAFAEGLVKYDELEYASALDAFVRSAAVDDQHVLTHSWMSRAYLILNRKNEAAASAQRARALGTNALSKSEAAFVAAVSAESRGDLGAAEESYRKLVTAEPDDPWALAELADFLKRRQDRNQPAIDEYHELLRLDPTYVRPHVDLCQLYTRIDDHPLAEKEAALALDRYRTLGLKGGQAQTLLCLGEAQREQGGPHMAEARTNVEAARELIRGLDQPYNLSRAVFYQASLEYSDGRLRDALQLFEDAAAKSHAVGNRLTEGTALMNLGVINFYLGRPTPAMDFYRRSREVFLSLGDERRVAEMDVNAAGLQIDYANGREEGLKTLANAKANLEKLGHVDFQLVALQTEAEADRYIGRIDESRTLLRSALQIARERQLASKTTALRTALAQTDLEANDYEAARTALEELVNQDASNEAARIELGVVLTRLGDFAAAKGHLDRALADAQKLELVGLLPSIHAALGELAYQMKRAPVALEQFDLAVNSWSDPLQHASSVEARCSRAMLRVFQGQDSAVAELNAAVESAVKMQRLSVEIHCRIELAKAQLSRRRYADALAVLKNVPEGKSPIMIGPESQAQVAYWRGVAAAAGDEAEGRSAAEDARARIEAFKSTLPAKFRDLFAARLDISEILFSPSVRSHQ